MTANNMNVLEKSTNKKGRSEERPNLIKSRVRPPEGDCQHNPDFSSKKLSQQARFVK